MKFYAAKFLDMPLENLSIPENSQKIHSICTLFFKVTIPEQI